MTYRPNSGNDPVVTPKDFGAIIDGGRFGDGLSHPASANGFATLAALQSQYPFATALTNDMAGLMIQAAVNAAHANGRCEVALAPGRYYNLPKGIVMPAQTNVKLKGAGPNATVILCSPCGTNPAITVNGANNAAEGPVSNIGFWGFDSKVFGTDSNRNGNSDPALYSAGSIGIYLVNCYYMTFYGLLFQNFDQGTEFDEATGNNYLISFRDCVFQLSNIGYAIKHFLAPNSYERMVLDNCVISNNNIGALLIFGDGHSTSVAADVYFRGCSLDYNVVTHVQVIANASDNFRQSRVHFTDCHLESSSVTSGTSTARILNGGDVVLKGCEIAEQGTPPQSFVAPTGYWAATRVIGCSQNVPFTYVGSAGGLYPLVHGMMNVGGALYATNTGNVSTGQSVPANNVLSSPFTLSEYSVNALLPQPFVVGATLDITVPADSGSFNLMNGTEMRFTSRASYTGTFRPGSGVTIASSGSGLTFGGAKPATVYLTKVASNTWMVTGQMT